MNEHKPLYPYSLAYATEHGEKDLWRESYQENCDCARAIERMIAEHYDGERLGDNLAQTLLERYGFNRVNWVLANTVQQNSGDGRIAPEHKRWAEAVYIPRDDHNWQYTVGSHPGLTNLFIRQVREAWDALGLFDASMSASSVPEAEEGPSPDGMVMQ